MAGQQERRHLVEAATDLRQELRKQHLFAPFKSMPDVARASEVFDTETGGWGIEIATWGSTRPKAALWFDRYLADGLLHFWFGFWSTDRNKIETLIDEIPNKIAPILTYTTSDTTEIDDISVLKRTPSTEQRKKSIYEHYNSSSWLGMYNIGQRFELRRAADFIGCVVNSVADDYPDCKVRSKVVSHLRFERDPIQARNCKARDKFRCQVCDFHFEERYGQLGREFAEAHHKVPLNRLRTSARIKLDDLITVCSNCHRMLHKMRGASGDIRRLRECIRDARRRPKRGRANGGRVIFR